MKKYRYLLRLFVAISILYTNLTPGAYCTQVRIQGLGIRFPYSPQQYNDAGASKLSSISTEIPVTEHGAALEGVLCTFEDDLSDVDTDDEGAHEDIKRLRKIPVTKNTRPYNRSRHPGQAKNTEDYDPTGNYVKAEFAPEKLRTQLSQGALDIVKALNNSESEKHTTCLCIALRDQHERVKKFVFHNGDRVMSPVMRTKARELGYDVIQTDRSHAEGQFMQFLLYRHKQRPGLYTHIMGMGCSRPHCSKCDHIFKTLLGSKYHEFTASVYEKHEEVVLPMTNQAEWGDLLVRLKKMSTNTDVSVAPDSFTPISNAYVTIKTPGVVLGQDATDNKDYNDYYLPKLLEQTLVGTTGKKYSLSSGWVTNSLSKEVVQQRKARKIT